MKVREYVESLKVNPTEELLSNFKLNKKYDLDFRDTKTCLNCGNKGNNTLIPSTPWTSAQYCWYCHSLNIVFHQDRMGGAYTDVIKCYVDK